MYVKIILIILFLLNLLFGQYSFLGPYSVSVESNQITVSDNSQMYYSLFSPINHESAIVSLIVHGFARNKSVMVGFAEHLASWGVATITMDLLHSSVINNDPLSDALDINILADQISQGSPIVYIGHSSGAMRSILAARQNSNTIAVLGFDLVDALENGSGNQYYALAAVSDITIPVWGMFSESSACNAYSNGINIFQEAEQGNAITITEADHCDFEFPTNFLCTIICEEPNYMFLDEDIRDVVLNLSTSFVFDVLDGSTLHNHLWQPGNSYYDSLITIGALQQITALKLEENNNQPNSFNLYNNFPNPFNSTTKIKYEIFNSGNVNILIVDSRGLYIKSLINEYVIKGNYFVVWDGKDSRGKNIPSGIYFYKMVTGGLLESKKMIYLK